MSKKVLFWIFLIIGIGWITGVSYWYIRVEGLNIADIHWGENFNSKDSNTQAFFRALLLVIIPLLVTALLFYCIGLFFGNKNKEILHKVEEENENLKNELAQHVDKIETMKALYTGGKIERKIKAKQEEPILTDITVKNVENIQHDDLKIIEGIGERIEFFLNDNGIYTWEQLSQTTEEKLTKILLVYGGSSYKIHNPASWPKQAELAFRKQWEELNILKEQMKKGT